MRQDGSMEVPELMHSVFTSSYDCIVCTVDGVDNGWIVIKIILALDDGYPAWITRGQLRIDQFGQ